MQNFQCAFNAASKGQIFDELPADVALAGARFKRHSA
jgi:hypothetical protein